MNHMVRSASAACWLDGVMTSAPKVTGAPPSPARRRMPAKQVCWAPGTELDLGQWAEVGRRIGSVGRNVQWVLGDWIAYGNTRFGERYSRAAKITGYDTQTLMNMVYVASHFSVSRRRENLSWSHHEALAALDPAEQDRWLDQAARHRWSVSDLRTMLRMARKEVRELGDKQPAEDQPARVLSCPRCGQEISVE
jgi:hypothetical protein